MALDKDDIKQLIAILKKDYLTKMRQKLKTKYKKRKTDFRISKPKQAKFNIILLINF